MYLFTLLAVGKLKEAYWSEAQAEYLRRLAPFARTEVIETTPAPITPTRTAEQSIKEEGERLHARIPTNAFVIALDRRGKRVSSEGLAGLIRREGGAGRRIVFIVGGTAGLADTILAAANEKISLSEMTFTHETARVILLEQLYRSATIIAGKTYHY